MRKLAGAGLGEMNAVASAKLADLALEVRTLEDEAAVVVDKAIPNIDVGDTGLFRGTR